MLVLVSVSFGVAAASCTMFAMIFLVKSNLLHRKLVRRLKEPNKNIRNSEKKRKGILKIEGVKQSRSTRIRKKITRSLSRIRHPNVTIQTKEKNNAGYYGGEGPSVMQNYQRSLNGNTNRRHNAECHSEIHKNSV